MINSVAVLDVGSARLKLLIVRVDAGEPRFERFKEELGLGGLVNERGELSAQGVSALREALARMVAVAESRGCQVRLAVATDTVRSAPNGKVAVDEVERAFGPVSVLSPSTEAQILRAIVLRRLEPESPFVVIDVGGGSVQIAWGDQVDQTVSLPTGTFRLEREFQRNDPPTEVDYEAMRSHLRHELDARLPHSVTARTLVVGSNCMEEFLVAAVARAGEQIAKTPKDGVLVEIAVLKRLLSQIAGKPYDSLGDYYPKNVHFMRGADKALLNVLEIGDRIGAEVVMPTDESISSSLAWLALNDASSLGLLGIVMQR